MKPDTALYLHDLRIRLRDERQTFVEVLTYHRRTPGGGPLIVRGHLICAASTRREFHRQSLHNWPRPGRPA